MAKRKKKSSSVGLLFILGLLLVAGATAGGLYLTGRLQVAPTPPAAKPVVTVTPKPVVAQRDVVIYVPKRDPNGFHLGQVTRTTSEKGDILDVAVKCLLATNKESGIVGALIPEGVRLISPIRVDDRGIATVNFSEQLTDNFSGGSDQEALTVNAIVHTVVSNSGGKVQSVKILVEGKTVDTLGGHFELTEPVEADSTLLRPGSIR